jgi:hypothetical protein
MKKFRLESVIIPPTRGDDEPEPASMTAVEVVPLKNCTDPVAASRVAAKKSHSSVSENAPAVVVTNS